MNSETRFLEALENTDLVVRLRELKALIEANPAYLERFSELIKNQKKLVQIHAKTNGSEAKALAHSWTQKLELIESDPIIQEYLERLETLNDVIQNIMKLIEQSLQETDKP